MLGNLENISANTFCYFLCGLRAKHVLETAAKNNIDGPSFIGFLYHNSVEDLAYNPIGLITLLNEYKKSTDTDYRSIDRNLLYEKMVLLKCSELNLRNQALFLKALPDPIEKYLAAQYLATRMLFEDKSSIFTEPDLGIIPDDSITISDLTNESWKEYSLRSVFFSALFQPKHPSSEALLTWAQRGLWEFCAAKYLSASQISDNKLWDLLYNKSTKRVYSQLSYTTALLINFRKDLFDLCLQNDPSLLLRVDFSGFTDIKKDELLKRLLETHSRGGR